MNSIYQQMIDLILRCKEAVDAIQPRGGAFTDPSPATRTEYLRLADTLYCRARYAEQGLIGIMQGTGRSSTFYKRLAALRYFMHHQQFHLMRDLQQADEQAQQRLLPQLQHHLQQLQTVAEIQQSGLCAPRRKRNSKRRALTGLPQNWREMLCERGKAGKYGEALLIAALSGCRPAELQKGISIWRAFDKSQATDMIYIEIIGAKVKTTQGQPRRIISYAVSDGHSLIAATNGLLDQQDESFLHVQVASAGNFTVEVRRLGKILWPKHKHAITAYCFRHQWGADMKRLGDSEAVSRGLGHVSAKTRRLYGTDSQSSDGLRPLEVEASRPVRDYVGSFSHLLDRKNESINSELPPEIGLPMVT